MAGIKAGRKLILPTATSSTNTTLYWEKWIPCFYKANAHNAGGCKCPTRVLLPAVKKIICRPNTMIYRKDGCGYRRGIRVGTEGQARCTAPYLANLPMCLYANFED